MYGREARSLRGAQVQRSRAARGTAAGRRARPGCVDGRARRALRAAACRGRGDGGAEAPGDPLSAAEGGGLVVPGDLPSHRVLVHEGQPLP